MFPNRILFVDFNTKEHDVNEYDQKDFDKGKKIIQDFSDLVNRLGQDGLVDGMVDGFIRQHRTLQQNIVRAFVEMLGKIGKEAKAHKMGYADARNEKSIELAIDLHERLANYELFFPHV